MHILGFLALVALVLLYFFVGWLLSITGVIKPRTVIPSGVAIGEEAVRTLPRSSYYAERHIIAHDKMITLTDDHNGEVWRVLSFVPAIDNTYEFRLRRVA